MTSTLKMALLAAAGFALAGTMPAYAASTATEAFVANVHPNVDFLDQSSRLALTTSGDAKVRAFAREEATEQTLASNSLVAWTETHTPAGVAVAVGATPAGTVIAPVAEVATVPLNVATNVTTGVTDGVGDVLTGRSVAIDVPLTPVTPAITVTRTPAPGTLLPSEQTDMDRLSTLRGRRFDAFYMTTQKDALRQLATLYTDYLREGDDPALRDMAERQLLIVKHRLAQLRAM